jgi:hypothetical protein
LLAVVVVVVKLQPDKAQLVEQVVLVATVLLSELQVAGHLLNLL